MKYSLTMRYIFSFACWCLFACGTGYGVESPDANDITVNRSVNVSAFKDIKKQKLSISPQLSTQKIFPNLEPLITQLQRFSELKLISQKLMPWIYLNSTESMVADFETTITQLEIADANLQSAMYEAFVNNDLVGMSPKIKNAAGNLDLAEFTLKLLLEIVDAQL